MDELVGDRISRIVREEWPQLMAVLMRDLGDLDAAEDAAQEAAEAALKSWLDDGIPDRPGAWMTTVARRRAVDSYRRDRTRRDKTELLAQLEQRDRETAVGEPADDSALRDDQLRLIFGCCHPALGVESQIALTLRSVGGLTTREIAAGFLVAESTMAQRLVRAKKKIAAAAIPFRIPDDHELLERLAVVHHVLYLIFNEGYVASEGAELARPDLSAEAIRLTRLLAGLVPDDAETRGLLAMFLLIEARRPARTADDGTLVLLQDQDRSLWDAPMITAGTEEIDGAVRLARPGPYQIEAAINAIHDGAATAADTDWDQIAALYGRLVTYRPTPVVRLNQAVAVAMAQGPEAGLEMLDAADLAQALDGYHYYWAARGDLLHRAGRDGAATAYRRAVELVNNEPERRFLESRIRLVEAADSQPEH